jgi:hypothetical protein
MRRTAMIPWIGSAVESRPKGTRADYDDTDTLCRKIQRPLSGGMLEQTDVASHAV